MKKEQGNAKCMPLFPFGYGLSYTTFKVGKPSASNAQLSGEERISIKVPVTNTGSRSGSETVQLYISELKPKVERPVKELKAFSKVFLQPGEMQEVEFTIDRSALSYYDDQAGCWTAEPGTFEALVGTSSANIAGSCRLTLKE